MEDRLPRSSGGGIDVEGLELKPGPGWSPGAASLLTERERALIDRYCMLDDYGFIDDTPPDSRSPREHVITERTAMRVLCRHYQWIPLKPGCLVKSRLQSGAR
jgi:hypothetical protein